MALPFDTRELLRELNATFPARCIRKGETLEDAHRYAGKRELIDYLITHMEEDE